MRVTRISDPEDENVRGIHVSASDTSALSTTPAFLAMACVGAFLSPTLAHAADPAALSADGGASGTAMAGEGGGHGTAYVGEGDDKQWIMVKGKYAQPDVASAKSTAPLLDTPQTITILNKDVLQKENLLTLRDALSTLPGITFGAGEGGGGFGDSINLRGYSANTDITKDGVRDSAQYSRTETFDLQQIEVYNGANSVFNGSGSVGGTINLVSKLPQGRTETTVSPSIGTDDYYRATVDSNIRVNDLIAFRLNAVYHQNDVPGRDTERFKRWAFAPAVTIGIDSPTRLTLMGYYQHDNNVPQYGVPYFAAGGGKPAGLPYSGYYGYRNIDEQKQTVTQLTAIFEHDFSDNISIRNLTRYENVRQLTIVDPPQAGMYALNGKCYGSTPANTGISNEVNGACPFTIAAATSTAPAITANIPDGYYLPGGPRGNLRDTRNQLGYDQIDLRAHFNTGILQNELVLGGAATWEHYNLDTGREFLNADGSNPYLNTGLPLINIADPSRTIVGPSVSNSLGTPLVYGNNVYSGPINYVRSSKSIGEHADYAAYLFDTTKIGKLFEVNFGVRWEHSSGSFNAITYNTSGPALGTPVLPIPVEQNNADNLFSYRIGGVFKPTESISIYVAYGNSKTPSISTVNGGCTTGTGATLVNFCDFQPEKAKNYEIGAKADLFHHRLQLTAAAFRNQRSNFRIASTDPANTAPIQIPDGRSRVDGIALGATGNITHAWAIFANYTYLKSKVLQGYPDRCVADPLNTADNCAAVTGPLPQTGGPLQATPKNSGSLFTTYTLPFGLQIGYGFTYQGKFAIVTDRNHLINGHYPMSDDYWVHRFMVSYPITRQLTAQVNVQNFTNAHYYTSIRNNGWAVPGALRSATASLFYNF
jgi:catecholate siderophore receptor